VCVAIAMVCALAFAATWLTPPPEPDGRALDAALQETLGFWVEKPYLRVDSDLLERLARTGLPDRMEAHRTAWTEAGLEEPIVGVTVVEQQELDRLVLRVSDALAALDAQREDVPLRRWALVPARGWAQPGWLSYAFLHLGWLHLLGNLFTLLFLVGPALEDAWGRGPFALFYGTGAVAAAVMYALVDPGSTVFMVGASGAIAACVGAFVFRFARRRVVVANLLFAWRGLRAPGATFTVPAWLWGVCWFGLELHAFLTQGHGAGVAFMAHLGGFGFGAVVAVAAAGRGGGHVAGAPQEGSPEAEALADALRLVRTQATLGQHAAATDILGRTLAPLLARGAVGALLPHGAQLVEWGRSGVLPHTLAFRVGTLLEDVPGHPEAWRQALALHQAVAVIPGPLGQKALLRGAALRLARREEVEVAAADLTRLRETGPLPPAVLAQLEQLEADWRKLRAA
jgi:membrane associated rhomboid family serine protease